MKNVKLLLCLSLLLPGVMLCAQNRQWSLQQCLDYAMENNIQIKQKALSTKQSHEDVVQSKSALFPSVSLSTSQNMSYRPFSDQTVTIDGGTMTSSSDALSYNGSYGLNARWTLWDGGRNQKTLQRNELQEQQYQYAEQEQANSIQEQIAKLYIQILYQTEAIRVNEEILKASQMQLERAVTMVETGLLAQVDKVQLQAQVAQDELSLVTAQAQLSNFKLQLKQLLEIHDGDFDVLVPEIDDSKLLTLIPQQSDVYNSALDQRPEIKSRQLAIESSTINLESARSGYWPSVSLSGGIGSGNYSAQTASFGDQMKNNLSCSMGLSVSIPIFDNNETRTNVRKALYNKDAVQLELQQAEKELYSTIENYYLEATTSQLKYVYAKKNVASMQESYDLVSEQFRLGLKNIVELTTGKNNLLQAQQNLLENKYTTLYNQAMLRFYKGENINF